jgi:Holliday junction resolvase
MTPEGKIKAKIKKVLESVPGCYFFMPPANGYGRAGIPDFVGCLNGRFFAIEAKAGKGKTTALQDREIAQIKSCGGFAIVVNEVNVDELKTMLDQWGRQEWIF